MNTKRQWVICIFLCRVLYFGLGISSILAIANNFTLISYIMGFILGFIFLIIMLNLDWYNFFKSIIGKIVVLGLSFFMVNNCLVSLAVLGSNFYLINTPPLLIIIPLFILILYGVKKGIATTLRLSDILIFGSVIIGFLAVISIFKNIDFNNYLPINIPNKNDTFKCIFSSMVYSVSPIILELSLLKKDEVNKKAILGGYVTGSLTILLMILYILGVFSGDFARLFRYPEYILLKKVNLFNQFEHLETFLSILWFNDLLITSLIAGILINKVFKGKSLYVVGIFHLMFVYFFFINNYQHALLLYHYSYYILVGLMGLGITGTLINNKINRQKKHLKF